MMKVQLLTIQGIYRVSGKCELEHNRELLAVRQCNIPKDLKSIATDMLKVGVDKS